MFYLYEFVPVGGIIIFDDVMSHASVARFWNEFKEEQGLSEDLIRIDRHSAWFRKEIAVKIKWTYFRAPQDSNMDGQHNQGCPALISRLSHGKCHASWYTT